MKIFGPFDADFLKISRVTSYTIGIILDDKLANRAKILVLLPQPPKSMCFQGIRKEVQSVSLKTRPAFQCATWIWVEHVFIFTVHHEGPSKRRPTVLLWAPISFSTQLQLRSTRSRFILAINLTLANECIVYCASPS